MHSYVEPLNVDTPQIWALQIYPEINEIRTVVWVPMVSAVKGFHCIPVIKCSHCSYNF